eukprot:759327-Hanusia_phi.AAC.3
MSVSSYEIFDKESDKFESDLFRSRSMRSLRDEKLFLSCSAFLAGAVSDSFLLEGDMLRKHLLACCFTRSGSRHGFFCSDQSP